MNESKVWLRVGVSVDELVESLSEVLGQDEVFKLICDLDAAQADYDFTLRVRDHMASEIEACDKEMAKLDAKGSA